MKTMTQETTKATKTHAFERAGLGKAPFYAVGFSEAKYQACPGAPIQPGANCDYCGAGIINVYHVESADRRTFKVGCDCVAKTGDAALQMGTRADYRRWKAEQRAASRKAVKEAMVASSASTRDEVLAAHEGLGAALKVNHPVIRDIASRFESFGKLSEKQIAVVLKIASDEAARAAEVMTSAPRGKASIAGRIVSAKFKEDDFGGGWKMTVKITEPRGSWLAYGTVPRSILEAVRDETRQCNFDEVLRGKDVEFSATLERGNEAHFAFFSRPSKARVVVPMVAA